MEDQTKPGAPAEGALTQEQAQALLAQTPEYAELVELRSFSIKVQKLGEDAFALLFDTLYGRRYAFILNDASRGQLASTLTQAKVAP